MSEPSGWVDAYGDRLFRYAMARVRDEGAAQDLLQETFLAAFKSRERFKGDSSELTWMTGILRNKIFELYRRQAREVPFLAGEDGGEPEIENFQGRHWVESAAPRGGEPARAAESAEIAAALRGCLGALTPNVARAFTVREIDGVEPKAAADLLSVSPAHLAVLLYRARMRLRLCLERSLGKAL